ncbi:MAG: cob(I)yrinic acid a,c-diamide adenosyltransferase [Planctomycetota bacterium]
MVRIDRISTGTGDDGTTGLGDGTRVPKDDLRVEAYGSVDELNAALGLVVADGAPPRIATLLAAVQNDLFDVGSDLCVPGRSDDRGRIDASYVRRLERELAAWNTGLEPLSSFVLPGGSPLAARLHVARTICRRAERRVASCRRADPARTNPGVLTYLNRLSDLLFVLARVANDGGRSDVPWRPGEGKG